MESLTLLVIVVTAWMMGAATQTQKPPDPPESAAIASTESGHAHVRSQERCHRNAGQIVQRDLTPPRLPAEHDREP